MNYKDEIKAIAFDFDGTLINFDYSVSPYTIKALDLLKQKNYKLCLASGRPCFLALKAFRNVFGDYPLDYVFGCNGSEMYDVRKDETKLFYPISAQDIRYIGKVLDNDFLMVGIYDGEDFLVNRVIESDAIRHWLDARWLKPIIYDFSQNDKPRSKVIVLNEVEDREREKEFMGKVDLSNFSAFYSSPYCFEIAPKGVSKATSCEVLAQMLDCDLKQILSFGDMENDMPMLECSSGVIMDNARDELKARIPLHTAAVDKEGIYDFLSKNGLI